MQLTMFAPSTESPRPSPSGKTSQAYSATKATPSDAFLARLLGKTANCSLQGKNGRTLVVCMDPKEQSRGGFWTPNISAWPNDAVVCSLSQVLETGSIPPRFFLSEKACAGILRRAEARGKTGTAPFGPALQCGCGHVFGEELGPYGCVNCEGDDGPAVSMFGGIPAFGGHSLAGSVERSATLTAKDSRLDAESETFFVVPPIECQLWPTP